MENKIIVVEDDRNPRRRTRIVDAEEVANQAASLAREHNSWRAYCSHGGTVANNYSYPAFTDAILAIALPPNQNHEVTVLVWATQIAANKATLSGAAGNCLNCAREIFDCRYGKEKKKLAWIEVKKVCLEFLKNHSSNFNSDTPDDIFLDAYLENQFDLMKI